jgi:hypothetical protein
MIGLGYIILTTAWYTVMIFWAVQSISGVTLARRSKVWLRALAGAFTDATLRARADFIVETTPMVLHHSNLIRQ